MDLWQHSWAIMLINLSAQSVRLHFAFTIWVPYANALPQRRACITLAEQATDKSNTSVAVQLMHSHLWTDPPAVYCYVYCANSSLGIRPCVYIASSTAQLTKIRQSRQRWEETYWEMLYQCFWCLAKTDFRQRFQVSRFQISGVLTHLALEHC